MRIPLIAPDNPVLRTKAKKVRKLGDLGSLADDLLETMYLEGGVGLAAPQVGQGVRVFVTAVEGDRQVFINPKITWRSEERIEWEEGCLSLPRLFGIVVRPKAVRVRALDIAGKEREIESDGLLGRVMQHETDHLDGVLFPDRMDDLSTLRKVSEKEWESRHETNREGGRDDGKASIE